MFNQLFIISGMFLSAGMTYSSARIFLLFIYILFFKDQDLDFTVLNRAHAEKMLEKASF